MPEKNIKTQEKNKNNVKPKKGLRIFAIVMIILIIVIAGILSGGIWYVNDKLGKIDYDSELNKDDITVNSGISEKLSKYRNIALFGLDSRTGSLTESRSDCIIIVSINQETKNVKLLSIYRDTYLKLTDASLDKVTHAYAYGGAKLALSTLNENLDLNITEYVTVNFETVKTVVDAIGGIQMSVTSAEANNIPGISGAGTYNFNGSRFTVEVIPWTAGMPLKQPAGVLVMDADKMKFPFVCRRWREGDWLIPLGMRGKKKVSDLFTDLKYDALAKDAAIMIVDTQTEGLAGQQHVAGLLGVRIDDRYKVTSLTKTILRVECK